MRLKFNTLFNHKESKKFGSL